MPPKVNPDDAVNLTLDLRVRHIPERQLQKYESYLAEILEALGMDLDTPSTRETPRRYLRALFDASDGYDGDPRLVKLFPFEPRSAPEHPLNQIVEGPIQFYALCEHHALPFFGEAFVGYSADAQIIGISKLTRLVRLFSRRFTLQERIGHLVADALMPLLKPYGVAIYLKARHLCVEMRGVRAHAPMTQTTVWRGEYADQAALRSEFLALCGLYESVRPNPED